MALIPALLASLLGFPAGMIVAFIAPEELNAGMRYFKVLSFVLGLCLIGSFIYALLYQEYVFFLSFMFLLGIPLGSIAAEKFLKRNAKDKLLQAIK